MQSKLSRARLSDKQKVLQYHNHHVLLDFQSDLTFDPSIKTVVQTESIGTIFIESDAQEWQGYE